MTLLKKTVPLSLMLMLQLLLFACATNPRYSEYSPTISPDGRMLLYQSDRITPGEYDVYVKFKTRTGWSMAIPLLFANSHFNTAGPFVTYDGNNLIITSDQPGGEGYVDIWVAERKKLVWGVPHNIGAPVNTKGYDGFASLSPDGKTLYFVRECPDKKGYKGEKFCLFMATRKETAKGKPWEFNEPVRLPYPVNTDYSEFAPVILADGRTLLFSSSRPGGKGGYDLYKTEMLDERTWSDPVNLGPSINTACDDRVASVPATGEVVYSSQPLPAQPDVFRIKKTKLPESLLKSPITTVSGIVRDRCDPDRTVAADILITETGTNRSRLVSSNEDGRYHIILQNRRHYHITVSCKDFVYYDEKLDLRGIDRVGTVVRNIDLEPLEKGKTIVFHNLQFDHDSDSLLSASRRELAGLVTMMRNNPEMKIGIDGHTDQLGTDGYNQTLSEKRAQSVRAFLCAEGIAGDRMTARGFGRTRPLVSRTDRAPEPVNRRVEITVVSVQ